MTTRIVRSALLLAVAAATAAGCAEAPAGPVFGQAEAQLIRDRAQGLEDAVNTQDPDQALAFYSGESILMPPQASTLRGRDAIRTFYQDLYTQGTIELEMDTSDVGGQGELAYEAGTFRLTRRPEGAQATRDRGKYLFVWRLTNGQWLIDYTIWSSDLSEPVPVS